MDTTALRSMVAGFLTDTCTITTPGAGPIFDEDTGTTTDAVGAEVYDGPCRVIPGGGRIADIGDAAVPLGQYDVRLPWDTTGLEVNQTLTVADSTDPALIGQQLRIVQVHGGTGNAYRRLICDSPTAMAELDDEEV